MKVIEKQNFVKSTLTSLQLHIGVLILLFVVGLCIIAFGINHPYFFVFIVAGAFISIFTGYWIDQKNKEINIWKAGLIGQENVENILNLLSDEWNLINNYVIPRKSCDIDHLLVGPKGIFVIETKNYNGKIECNGDSWSYTKTGKNGGIYKGHINNPSKQLKRNVWELRNYLEKKIYGKGQLPFWIQGILVFTNTHAQLELRDETVVVLKTRQLIPYLQKFQNEPIPATEIKRIIKVLSRK